MHLQKSYNSKFKKYFCAIQSIMNMLKLSRLMLEMRSTLNERIVVILFFFPSNVAIPESILIIVVVNLEIREKVS